MFSGVFRQDLDICTRNETVQGCNEFVGFTALALQSFPFFGVHTSDQTCS